MEIFPRPEGVAAARSSSAREKTSRDVISYKINHDTTPFIRLARLARYLRYTRLVVDKSIHRSSMKLNFI
jgi:hypothetical protein